MTTMTTLVATALSVTTVASWIAMSPVRAPFAPLQRAWWPTVARCASVVTAMVSAWMFARVLGTNPGWIVALGVMSATASIAILLLPLAGRAVWIAFAIAAAIAVIGTPIVVAIGAARG